MKKTAYVVYGRMNPPTKGHEMLIRKAATMAKADRAPLLVYTTFTYNGNTNPRKKTAAPDGKNPLNPREKALILHKIFKGNALLKNLPRAPGARRALSRLNVRTSKPVGTGAVRTREAAKKASYPFRIIYDLKDQGYERVVLVVGSDRVSQFKKMLAKTPGAEVRSAGERDPNSNNINGVSGTKARAAAVRGNIDTFSRIMSNSLKPATKAKYATIIQKRAPTPIVKKTVRRNPTPSVKKYLINKNNRSYADILRKSL